VPWTLEILETATANPGGKPGGSVGLARLTPRSNIDPQLFLKKSHAIGSLVAMGRPKAVQCRELGNRKVEIGPMAGSADEDFRNLLERVSLNDEDAINELVRRYEPEIRIMVRAWLRPYEFQLRKVFDSQDICQSVLAWFFLKNAAQRYDLTGPDNLRKLLHVMVRNRVFYRVRGSKYEARWQPMPREVCGRDHTPDELISDRDLVERVFEKFSPEEAELARRRINGASWDEISSSMGGTADGRRMQMARAASRLARELSLSE